jgi:eukaryotic-like serine/threonine-protein kinase
MTPDRWRQIEELYHAAQKCHPKERAALLDCTDPEIRLRVERMLAVESGSQILKGGDVLLADPTQTVLVPGSQLGPYEIQAQVGAGGMGTVYRALDTRLGRVVAIKIAAERYSERFQREARAISKLNHPHICTLYDVGPNYLVMELIEGSTLAAEIQKGPLGIEKVARYGAQIASALAEAHALGIVHRDLKPSNIMLTRHGVKVLDFGLAKIAAHPARSLTDSQVMGTPAYMAPEQVKGEATGPPADLFALGLVLFEMAEGMPPVPGVSLGAAWASGTNIKVPPLSNGSRAARCMNTLIVQLLEPDSERRLASATEIRVRLDRLRENVGRKETQKLAPLVAAFLILAVLAGAGIWWSRTRSAATNALVPVRVTKLTSFPGDEVDPAFSPDGRSVAFSWNGEKGDNYDIYTMPAGSQTPARLTEDVGNDMSPAWSPDGHQIAFLRLSSVSKGSLMVIPAEGGRERLVRDVSLKEDMYRAMRPLLTWTPDGNGIVYTTLDPESGRAGLYLTDLQGSAARRLFPSGEENIGNTSPAFSGDGKWLAYTEVYGPYHARLFVRPVNPGVEVSGRPIRVSGPQDTLIGSPVWTPRGNHLLFRQDAAILDWTPGGSPEQVYVTSARLQGMSARWMPGRRIVTADSPHRELFTIPLRPGGLAVAGDSAPFVPSSRSQSNPQFSPDGKWIVFHSTRSGAGEVWMAGFDGRNPRQLTHLNATQIGYPRWSPDSRHIAFHAWIGNKPQIFTIDLADLAEPGKGSEAVMQITNSAFGFIVPSWSANQQYLYVSRIVGGSRTFRIPAKGGTPEDLFEGSGDWVTRDGGKIIYFKVGHPGIFSRSLDGDPSTNAEEKLVEDYKAPGADLNPFPDGLYYISWNGDGKPRAVRFYSYSQRKSVDVVALRGLLGSPADLAVSPDRRRLVYDQFSGMGTDLTLIEFR